MQGPRLVIFACVMAAFLIILVVSLYQYQFTDYQFYVAASDENSKSRVPLPSARGVIFDRFGQPLAFNVGSFNISIIPANLPDDEKATLDVLNRLAALIDVPATRAAANAAGKFDIRSLQEQVQEGNNIAPYRPVVVKVDVPREVANVIKESNRYLPGVQVEEVSVRQYPTNAITSQIIGYLGPIGEEEANILREQGYNPSFERVGYSGIEAYLEEELAGTRGLRTQVVDVAGRVIRVLNTESTEPIAGTNFKLTIDLELQRAIQGILQEQMTIVNAEKNAEVVTSGTVIAMDPRNGQVLAMVSLPTYENARFARVIDVPYYLRVAGETQTPLVNHAIQSKYPPGSVWKLLTSVGVINEGVIAPQTTLNDPGKLTVINSFAENDIATKQNFVCWYKSGHQAVDLIRAIAASCDVYYYQVGGGNDEVSPTTLRRGGLGVQDFVRYSTMMYVGVDTGIELPAEISARMPDPDWKRRNYGEGWSTGDTYNIAFGQGYIDVTPLQLTAQVAAIVNGGTYYQPTVIESRVDSEGRVVEGGAFIPRVARTMAFPTDGSLPVLNMREDMYLQGKNSLVCTCESAENGNPYRDPENTEYYDPNLPPCSDAFKDNYTAKFIWTPPPFSALDAINPYVHDPIEVTYRVHVPYSYSFNGAPFIMCDPLRIAQNQPYNPPFVNPAAFALVQRGMREVVTGEGYGTASKNSLIRPDGSTVTDHRADFAIDSYNPAGKTGTAEYCDELANAKGICIPGAWPTHAWYVGYATYENPEIVIMAFLYNGGEGSLNAMPVVNHSMQCYFQFQQQRQLNPDRPVRPCEYQPMPR